VLESEIVIDRPKGSHHPRYPEIVYPVDYGVPEKHKLHWMAAALDVWCGTKISGKT